ncbi:MAG: DUF3035 domain-containing protein [Alphaproteobacteria bacterium]|nr:DUF3035 domain-containing protein [Alphaproteobacteria bacterium]
MKKIYVVLALVAVLALSSCGWTKKTLGMAKTGPDETLVKTNRPLILPPDYEARPIKNLVKAEPEEEADSQEISGDSNNE